MPALTTHKIFAEQVLKEINTDLVDTNTYYMFAQSHDILFYYKGKDYKLYNALGKKAHHKKTKQYITNIIECLKNNQINDKQCYGYLFGIITHYYLDSTLHPYIFYKTGVNRNTKDTEKYKGQHNLFERTLDSILYQRTYNKTYNECNISEEIIPKVILNNKLTTLLNFTYSKTYDIKQISNIIIKGYNTMRLFHDIVVEDKHSVKYNLYKTIDKLSNNQTNCLRSYSTSVTQNQNILNLKNKNWYHPVTKELHNESIPELIDIAKIKTVNTINKIIKYLNNDTNISYKDLIQDIDYSTGLLIKDNKKMRYFEY